MAKHVSVTEKTRVPVKSEKEVRQEFERVASKSFLLWPEVGLTHWSGKKLRIDYLANPMCEFPAFWIGFEIKTGMDGFNSLTTAMRQAIDYRQSGITGDRFGAYWQGQRPRFVFVYNPDWVNFSHEYKEWMQGVERMVGQFNVGTAYRQGKHLELRVSSDRLWDSTIGPRCNANAFGSSRKVGSK